MCRRLKLDRCTYVLHDRSMCASPGLLYCYAVLCCTVLCCATRCNAMLCLVRAPSIEEPGSPFPISTRSSSAQDAQPLLDRCRLASTVTVAVVESTIYPPTYPLTSNPLWVLYVGTYYYTSRQRGRAPPLPRKNRRRQNREQRYLARLVSPTTPFPYPTKTSQVPCIAASILGPGAYLASRSGGWG